MRDRRAVSCARLYVHRALRLMLFPPRRTQTRGAKGSDDRLRFVTLTRQRLASLSHGSLLQDLLAFTAVFRSPSRRAAAALKGSAGQRLKGTLIRFKYGILDRSQGKVCRILFVSVS